MMRAKPVPGRSQRGFSLLELAVVLLVLGLLTWGGSSAFDNVGAVRERDLASRNAEALQQALRAFALQNARLPCPDLTGQGWEGNAAGQCPAGAEAGWLPYRALGLELPSPALQAAYSVYRNTSASGGDADLAVRTERTGDASSSASYQDVRDLIVGLNRAQAAVLSNIHTRLTGDADGEGAIDCSANLRSNPAYWLVIPLQDRDQNGDRFDSVHALNFSCAYSPGTAVTVTRDDVVRADTLATLAGWLAASAS